LRQSPNSPQKNHPGGHPMKFHLHVSKDPPGRWDARLCMEEITNLTEEGGKPADTLMNVVALIAARFGPMSARPICWSRTDRTWCWPRPSACIRDASARCACRCTKGLAGLVAEQVLAGGRGRCQEASRFKYFKESGEEEYHSFLGVPLIDRGVLQGVLVVQTKRAARLSRRRDSHAGGGGQPGGAGGERGAHAGPLHRAGAGAAVGAGAQSVVELGSRLRQPVSRSESDALAQLNQNPISLLSEMPLGRSSARATELVLHSRINYVTGASRSICRRTAPGARQCGRAAAAAGGLFLRRVRLHESLPIYSGGLGVLAGDHIKSASDLDIPLVGIGLFYGQGYFLQRLDQERLAAGRVSADRRESTAHAAGHRAERRAGGGGDRNARRLDRAKVWR
jgi:glycogen phosphorylase